MGIRKPQSASGALASGVEFIGSATFSTSGSGAISETLSIPGTKVGDMVVICMYADQGYVAPTWSGNTPSFIAWVNGQPGNLARYNAYGLATEADQVSLIDSTLGTGDWQDRVGIVAVFRGVDTVVGTDTADALLDVTVIGTGRVVVFMSGLDDSNEDNISITNSSTLFYIKIANVGVGTTINACSASMYYALDKSGITDPEDRITWDAGGEPVHEGVILLD